METSEIDSIPLGVGYVAIASSYLEFGAAAVAIELIGSPDAHRAVLGQSWSTVRTVCLSLLEGRILRETESETPDAEQLVAYRRTRRVLNRADDLMTERNNVIHALWVVPEAGSFTRIAMKRTGRHLLELEAAPADLDRLQRKIMKAATELRRDADHYSGRYEN